tara:strand:- start:531 stop:656 length:126 start_codon:yes stop_codon:yes gene_type:complete
MAARINIQPNCIITATLEIAVIDIENLESLEGVLIIKGDEK